MLSVPVTGVVVPEMTPLTVVVTPVVAGAFAAAAPGSTSARSKSPRAIGMNRRMCVLLAVWQPRRIQASTVLGDDTSRRSISNAQPTVVPAVCRKRATGPRRLPCCRMRVSVLGRNTGGTLLGASGCIDVAWPDERCHAALSEERVRLERQELRHLRGEDERIQQL